MGDNLKQDADDVRLVAAILDRHYQSVCDYLGCDHGPEDVAAEVVRALGRRWTTQEVGDFQASEAELVAKPLRAEIARLKSALTDGCSEAPDGN